MNVEKVTIVDYDELEDLIKKYVPGVPEDFCVLAQLESPNDVAHIFDADPYEHSFRYGEYSVYECIEYLAFLKKFTTEKVIIRVCW